MSDCGKSMFGARQAPNGSLVAANFDAWFSRSQVLDESGLPLRVFHGTNQDIDAFSLERLGASTSTISARGGFFFCSDPRVAAEYAQLASATVIADVARHERESRRLQREMERAERRGDWDEVDRLTHLFEAHDLDAIRAAPSGANVMAVYLALQNPARIDAAGTALNSGDVMDAIASAQMSGRDGLIIANIADSPYGSLVCDHYVTFSADQIKSVTGNCGLFARGNPDVTDRNLLRPDALAALRARLHARDTRSIACDTFPR